MFTMKEKCLPFSFINKSFGALPLKNGTYLITKTIYHLFMWISVCKHIIFSNILMLFLRHCRVSFTDETKDWKPFLHFPLWLCMIVELRIQGLILEIFLQQIYFGLHDRTKQHCNVSFWFQELNCSNFPNYLKAYC